MIRGKYLGFGDDLSGAAHVRNKVLHAGLDEKDNLAINVVVYDGSHVVGTGRITPDDFSLAGSFRFTIDKVCVLEEYRNSGYGDFIVRMLADRAANAGADKVYAHIPVECRGFFEKLMFIEDKSTVQSSSQTSTMVLTLKDLTTPCGGHCQN
ncbi:GNAT family N-acetyltransferase [Parasporobacterium paucivorans]|uniref:Acetyltransferase (GNAT) domain-containing protein n=1 Tax=Parasporobacterium paucivorans DSM 15970 TaxID=1122934 RepID=A0A1M6BH01_9FIRM|nr:GNAT family N-acetyltransferase [Parasporobacterium paucivorans]SHI48050.1 Acetyltransferase (GNAT) domain-containing protein [Parasporobacterium paucivorans DSM 15970]